MYEEWFQLVQRPFGSAPDSKIYFASHGMEAARSAMTRCIERSRGLGLVIGPTGVGKTTLGLKLVEQLRGQGHVAYLSGRGVTAPRELWQTILFELGVPYGQEETELHQQLSALLSGGTSRTWLICDDADELTPPLLSELWNLLEPAEGAGAILLGTLKLEQTLGRPPLTKFDENINARFYLHPFDVEETAAYVRYQMQHVGGCRNAVFSDAAVQAVFESSGGVARTVNQLCDHAMVLAMSNGDKRIGSGSIAEAWLDLQQLPAPETSAQLESGDEFIEFGNLEEPEGTELTGGPDHDPSGTDDLAADDVAASDQASNSLHGVRSGVELFPDTALDNIERQLAAIVEVEDRRSTRSDAVDDGPLAWIASNPFLESFDEEEVVLDLPLGIHGGPRTAGHKQQVADELEEQLLLEELLTQMGELEHRSLQLEQSLADSQRQLALAEARAVASEVERTTLTDATCGGDVGSQVGVEDGYTSYYAIDVGVGPGDRSHEQASELPTPEDRSEAGFVQFVDPPPQVHVRITDDVMPCEAVDHLPPPRNETGDDSAAVNLPSESDVGLDESDVQQTDEVTNVPTSDLREESSNPEFQIPKPQQRQPLPDEPPASPQRKHHAESWPPPA